MNKFVTRASAPIAAASTLPFAVTIQTRKVYLSESGGSWEKDYADAGQWSLAQARTMLSKLKADHAYLEMDPAGDWMIISFK